MTMASVGPYAKGRPAFSGLSVGIAGPEQGRAQPHMGGAKADGSLEIAAHAHGQDRQLIPSGDFGQQSEMRTCGLLDRRNGHQTLDRQTVHLARPGDEDVGVARRKTRLLGFLTGIDLNQHARPLAQLVGGPRQRLGQTLAVQGLDDVKAGQGRLGLVGLQRTDQPQFYRMACSLGRAPATVRLLHPVLAEYGLPGVKDGLHPPPRLGLGHGDKGDGVRIAPGVAGRSVDPRPCVGQTLGDGRGDGDRR